MKTFDRNRRLLIFFKRKCSRHVFTLCTLLYFISVLALLSLYDTNARPGKDQLASLEKKSNIVTHFVFIGKQKFTLGNYISIASNALLNKPRIAYFHFEEYPKGIFWDMAKNFIDIESRVLSPVGDKSELMLTILNRFGGFVVDLNVISLKSVADLVIPKGSALKYPQEGNSSLLFLNPSSSLKSIENFKGSEVSEIVIESVSNIRELSKQLEENRAHFFVLDENMNDSYTEPLLSTYLPSPFFSVVMPCYDQEKFVADAIESVLKQKFSSWELILVDDHSPDECGKSVKKWMHQKNLESAKQIHVIINEQNIGVAESRNIGIKSSIGQFICTLDADDIISAEYFALAFGAILNNPEVSIVFSNLKLFGEKDGDWTPPEWDLLSSLTTGPLSSMTIFRRNLWESAEGVSSALPRSNEDYDFWLKLVELGPIAIRLDGFHTFYRYKSKSRMRDTMKYYAEEHAMMRIRHPILYHPEALLRDHELISHMLPGTREILESRINSNAFFNQEDKISTLLWLSFPYLHLNDFEKVEKILSQIEDEVKNPDVHPRILWQFNYQRVKMLCRLGKHSESISLLNSLLDSFPVLRFAPNIYSNIAACKSALL